MLGSDMNSSNKSLGPVAGKRPKVALQPGRSLMDWIRLGASGKDIQGFGGKLRTVSMKELARHNKEDDCWMLLRGNVYNITAYTEYHPGGIPELMRGAGKDGTKYFDEVHKWVNIESMLAKCLIGPIEKTQNKKEISNSLLPLLVGPPALSAKQDGKPDVSKIIPRYEWYQRDDCIIISIYTRRKLITPDALILDCNDGKNFNCKVLLEEQYYQIHIELENEILSLQAYGPTNASGKLEVKLVKSISGLKWKSLGEKLDDNDKIFDEKDRELVYRSCNVCAIETVTSNTKLFTIELPNRVYYRTPIGHHVLFEGEVQGMKISRNYTVALDKLDGAEANKNDNSNIRLHFMIKIYDDGAFTPLLNRLKVGDVISVSDCTGDFKLSRLIQAKSVYMIAAGTGLTPMLRIIDYIIKDSQTKRKACLLFANRHETDILWRNELDAVAENHSDLFSVEYILSRPSEDWKGLSGRIDKNILANYFKNVEKPDVEEEVLVCICGSTEFTQLIKGFLLEMEFTDTMIHCFLG